MTGRREGGSGRRWALGCALVLLLPALGLYLGRSAIATSLADDALRERRIACDERFSVRVGPMLQSAGLERTACVVSHPAVDRVELGSSAKVELSGAEVTRVSAAEVRVLLTDRRYDPGGVPLGPRWMGALALGERLAMAVGGLPELARAELPAIDVGALSLRRGDETLLVAHGVNITQDPQAFVTVERIELKPGEARVTADLVDVSVTRDGQELTVRATLKVDARVPVVGRRTHEQPVALRLGKGEGGGLSVSVLDP